MPKYAGKIGFAKQVEVAPGVWDDSIVERTYRGDILRNTNRWETRDKVNEDFNISNSVSVVADSFIYENSYAMKYLTLHGVRWSIGSFEEKPPRLIINIGGLYNGPEPEDDQGTIPPEDL